MYQKTVLFSIGRIVVLVGIVLWSVFPVFFMVLASFKSPTDVFRFPPSFVFRPTFSNYRVLLREYPQFFSGLWNSGIVSLGAAALTVLVALPAGYALSRYNNRFLSGSAFFMLIVRIYPPIVLTVPLFPVVALLGLTDSRLILVVLYTTFYISLSSWLMKTYMDAVPKELEEAASIDGANAFQRIVRIVIPLSMQGVVATSVFVIIYAWKEFTLAYIFAGSRVRTAPLVLQEMLSPIMVIRWGSLFAAAAVQLLPLVLFVGVVQAYLIRGANEGAVKG